MFHSPCSRLLQYVKPLLAFYSVMRQELNISNPAEKVKEYQQNYVEHILRMPTYRIPRKLFDCHRKGRRERGQRPKIWKGQAV
jgi:hypothetical protein